MINNHRIAAIEHNPWTDTCTVYVATITFLKGARILVYMLDPGAGPWFSSLQGIWYLVGYDNSVAHTKGPEELSVSHHQ